MAGEGVGRRKETGLLRRRRRRRKRRRRRRRRIRRRRRRIEKSRMVRNKKMKGRPT